MKTSKTNTAETPCKRRPKPATSPEARESQMISLAIDLAEQQLLYGTASSQVITHYLKLGSMKEQLEMDKLKEENKLLRAKTEYMESQKRQEELYISAIEAMKSYIGVQDEGNSGIQ